MIKPSETHRIFSGQQLRYQHQSSACQCKMTFSLYLPPQAEQAQVPLLTWLSGLTCTDENFSTKSGFQQFAARYGMAVLVPDTSPRGEQVADSEGYDLGQGAGFYVDATQPPWQTNFQMASYITDELPNLVHLLHPNIDMSRQGILGHSMGGHGAMVLGMKHAQRYRSISAFAPIVAPTQCDWGKKALTAYLGDSFTDWQQHDACEIMKSQCYARPILIDQGDADPFLSEQLGIQHWQDACEQANVHSLVRMQAGYDHSYYFIATFVEAHIRFHAEQLKAYQA